MADLVFLNTQNESFANDTSVIDSDALVIATNDQNAVTNSGVLWTTGDADTISFDSGSTNATITNTATGYIRGGNSALVVGGSATINNAGEMVGRDAVNVDSDVIVKLNNVFGGSIKGEGIGVSFDAGAGSEIVNDGTIYGGFTGVVLLGGTLTNSGEVGGSEQGIVADVNGASTIMNTGFGGIWSTGVAIGVGVGSVTITNDADCLITGTQAAITTGDSLAVAGRISLTNHGKIDGVIDCNAVLGDVNDAIVNKGIITDRIELGAGDDVFNGTGGNGVEVYGESGNDVLIGGAAADGLSGGAGADFLNGGLGRDELTGGADRDFFDFNSIKDSVRGAKRDFIADFQRGTDEIDLADIDAKSGGGNQKFKFIGKHDFHGTKGELHFKDLGAKCLVSGDVNGDGKADFEILVKAGSLSAGDFIL